MKYWKLFFAGLLAVYGIRGALEPCAFYFLRGVDTLFHEAGHPLFGVFGEGVGIVGGTLMQLLIPSALAVYFFKERRSYSGSVMLFWVAENLFGISVYIRDAREQALPYVGGDIHDWGYLLAHARWLKYDHRIADGVWWAGMVMLLISIILCVWFSGALSARAGAVPEDRAQA